MAKARTKKQTAVQRDVEQPQAAEPIDPKKVHELFGLPGPYDTKDEPIPTRNFVTWWDVGMSLNEMRRRQPKLFSHCSWLDGERFARDSDSWKFRQMNLTPCGLDEPMDPTAPDLPLARELVCYLVLVALATGERTDIGRLRCRDVMPSGQRVCVGPWFPGGLEICTVSDRWKSPIMGYCALYTPVMPPRKK